MPWSGRHCGQEVVAGGCLAVTIKLTVTVVARGLPLCPLSPISSCLCLRFIGRPNHYPYRFLPFGFSTAPRVLVVVTARLRKQGINVNPYLDD